MKSYGQFCPIAKAAEIFCERWTALVIRNLGAGAERFSDIHRGVPHMSATLLTRPSSCRWSARWASGGGAGPGANCRRASLTLDC